MSVTPLASPGLLNHHRNQKIFADYKKLLDMCTGSLNQLFYRPLGTDFDVSILRVRKSRTLPISNSSQHVDRVARFFFQFRHHLGVGSSGILIRELFALDASNSAAAKTSMFSFSAIFR